MYELFIEKMTCGHCASRISQAVKSVDAMAGLELDMEHKRIRIDSTVPMSRFSERLAESGYPATFAGE